MGICISYNMIDRDKLPMFNGVFWNEKIYEFHLINVPDCKKNDHRMAILEKESDSICDRFSPSVVCTTFEVSYIEKGLHLECGEGSWGGDGFVCLSTMNRQIVFLACFENSNPFIVAEYKEGCIRTMNNNGEIWVFEFYESCPPSIKISKGNPIEPDAQWKNREKWNE